MFDDIKMGMRDQQHGCYVQSYSSLSYYYVHHS
jgi:hypothetical protein